MQALPHTSPHCETLAASTSREAGLSALSGTDLDTALIIAKPWYLGYVGTPSGRILEDDAAFATFLEMQAYAKTGGIIPAQSYPPGPAGWWRDATRGRRFRSAGRRHHLGLSAIEALHNRRP
jgi:hypothetical protein